MATKTQTLTDYKKEYVYHLGSYVSRDGDYEHPYIDFIRLGTQYPEGRYFSGREFTIEFQRNLTDDHGQKLNSGMPYGGRVEYLSLTSIDDLSKIMKEVNAQIKRLEIHSPDYYQNMVTALRAAGYRKGIKENSEFPSHIVGIE